MNIPRKICLNHIASCLIVGIAGAAGTAAAQNPTGVPVDTTAFESTLGEITVTAPKVVRKADMDVYYPSKSAVAASQNGLALVNNLMIPSLSVNDIMGTVRTDGQDVEIRINGRRASVDELRALGSESIRRAEWIDNPGVRYGDAVAVLNVITVNPDSGCSLTAGAMPSLHRPWGNGYAFLKLNSGPSQWEIGTFGRYCNHMSTYREYSETFTSPDGKSLTRTETPIDGYVSQTLIKPNFAYSYNVPGRTTVWAGVDFNKTWPTVRSNTGLLSLSDGSGDILLHEKNSDSETRTRASVYFEQRFSKNRTLAIDIDASLQNASSNHDYRETGIASGLTVTDVATRLRERRHRFGAEADYIHTLGPSRITGGAQYSGEWTRQRRETGAVSRHTQQKVYLFGEYFRRMGRFTVTAGIGARYTHTAFGDDGRRARGSWSWQPRFTATWNAASHSKVRVSFATRTSAPSASQTDSQWQQIDGFQYQTGSRDLRTYAVYSAKLQYSFSFPRVEGRLEGSWQRAPRAIAPYMQWHDDRLVTAFENSRGYTRLQATLSAQVEIIPEYLVASGSLRFYRGHTSGTGYSHWLSAWSGNASLTGMWRDFTLSASFEANPKTLSGETVSIGEKTSTIMLGYHWKGLYAAVGMFMPFNDYSMGSRSLNRYNTNSNVLRSRSFNRMAILSLSYNLSRGRKAAQVSRLIDGGEETEASRAAGR